MANKARGSAQDSKSCEFCLDQFVRGTTTYTKFKKKRFCSIRCASRNNMNNPTFLAKLRSPEAQERAARVRKSNTLTLEQRFWKNIEKGCSDSECWQWRASTNKKGYGRIGDGYNVLLAHRYSYELHSGQKVPDDLFVLHECDNPFCCNPKHLFLGTRIDNNLDMKSKNRQARGPKVSSAKLTYSDVRKIRCLLAEGQLIGRIASMFGVHYITIHDIKSGRTWKHMDDQVYA